MTEIKDIELQFPCPLKKDSFAKTEKGYYCTSCSHEVIDFSDKSLNELQCAIEKSAKPVCGIFKKSQLSDRFIKYAATTLIVSSTIIVPAVAQENRKTDSPPTSHENLNNETDSVFFGTIIETQAEPIGGFPKFMKALAEEIRFPIDLKEKGKCFVEILIDTCGNAHDFKILRSLNEEVDREALRALTKLNYPWTPAKQRGKSLNSRFIMPIVFDPDKGREDGKK